MSLGALIVNWLTRPRLPVFPSRLLGISFPLVFIEEMDPYKGGGLEKVEAEEVLDENLHYRQANDVSRLVGFRRQNGRVSAMMIPPGIDHPRRWDWYFGIASKIPGSAPQNSEAFFNGLVRGSVRNLGGLFDQVASWW